MEMVGTKGMLSGMVLPERNNPAEISSAALAHHVECVCVRRCHPRRGGAKGFRRICRVVQHAPSEPGRCRRESFASVPEITLIPVKLTLCKISSPTLSPGFSLIPFSSDELETKEKSFHCFWFHLFFYIYV